MVFIETPVFTKRVAELLTDDEYSKLQSDLMKKPESGALIAGTGGVRKLRVGLQGRGKRGGARVIYYWAAGHDQFLMLTIYSKNVQGDLTPDQKRAMKNFIELEYRE